MGEVGYRGLRDICCRFHRIKRRSNIGHSAERPTDQIPRSNGRLTLDVDGATQSASAMPGRDRLWHLQTAVQRHEHLISGLLSLPDHLPARPDNKFGALPARRRRVCRVGG
jgi:hypothetical protein